MLNNTQKLLEMLPYLSGYWVIKSKDSLYQGATPAFYRWMQRSSDYLFDQTDQALWNNQALSDRIREDDQTAVSLKSNLTSFYQLSVDGHSDVPVGYHRQLVFNRDGEVESLFIEVKPVTHPPLKHLSEASLASLVQSLPCHVYLKNKEGVYWMSNDLQAQTVGFEKGEEIVGRTDYDLYTQECADEYRRNDLKVMRLERPIQIKEPLKVNDAQEKRIFITHKIPFYIQGKVRGVLGISTDITEEEHSKRKTEIYLENLLSNLPGHVYWKDKQGCYLGCNKLQANNLGFDSPEETIGKTDFDMPWKEQAEQYRNNDQKVMITGKSISIQEEATLRGGQTHVFLANKVPLKDDQGQIIGVLGISTDITELKKVQKQLSAAKTREAHFKAMSAIGGMMAHELRTPLSSIALGASGLKDCLPVLLLAYREYAQKPRAQKIRKGYLNSLNKVADNIEISARYASNTIKTILSGFHYSALETLTLESANISSLIQQALLDYPFTRKERAWVSFHPQLNCQVLCVPNIVIHSLHNLLRNALYAIHAAKKGKITIALKIQPDTVQIHCRDTAKGMSEAVRSHIFEPFYTTKDSDSSVGLGLYFCRMALNKMQASITCESKEREYTLFTITLTRLRSEKG